MFVRPREREQLAHSARGIGVERPSVAGRDGPAPAAGRGLPAEAPPGGLKTQSDTAPPSPPSDAAIHAYAWRVGSVEAAAARFGLSCAAICAACERHAARLTRKRMRESARW